MMDANDLRQILREDAADAPSVPAVELLSGIRRKVKARRLKRAGAAAASAAVLAAALLTAPQLIDASSPEPAEPPPEPSHLPFPDRLGGGQIRDSRVNEPGADTFELEVTLNGSDVSAVLFCDVRSYDGDWVRSRTRVVAAIEGSVVETAPCFVGSSYPPVSSEMAAIVDTATWQQNGLVASDGELTVSVWFEQDGMRSEAHGARFGFALYAGVRQSQHFSNYMFTWPYRDDGRPRNSDAERHGPSKRGPSKTKRPGPRADRSRPGRVSSYEERSGPHWR